VVDPTETEPVLGGVEGQYGSCVPGIRHVPFHPPAGGAVVDGITSRLAVTLSIVVGATVVIAIISVLLGVWAAVRGGWVDRVVQVITVLGFAIPGFLIALGLVLFFAINLGWFAPTGYVNFATSPSGWLQ